MADVLAASSGVAGLLTLGISVVEGIIKYYSAYKSLDSTTIKTTARLQSLLNILKHVDETVRLPSFNDGDGRIVAQIHECIEECEEPIQELQSEYQKLKKHAPGSSKTKIGATKNRVLYPFRSITLQKLDAELSELRANLSVAVSILELRSQDALQSGISRAESLLERIRSDQISDKIRNWLNAPDTYTDHLTALAQRHPGTGTWLIQSNTFQSWLKASDTSLLWLNGFAGCGKTVLCSTLIEYTMQQNSSQDQGEIGVAFYYFTFREEHKRTELAMLRVLLLQLASQLADGNSILVRLYEQHHGAPTASTLIYHIRHIISKFRHVYIFIDAIDESPRFEQRDRVLAAIEEIQHQPISGLHCLVTSRDEPDIREFFASMTTSCSEMNLKNAQIDADIARFISEKLKNDPRLKKWQRHQDRICKELSERAQGVFRRIECQLGELRRCLRSERHLDECLRSLPRTLDETYQRILTAIPQSHQKEARRLLLLLCFAAQPLCTNELLDAMAVSLEKPVGFDLRSRLGDKHDLQEMCPELIEFSDQQELTDSWEWSLPPDLEYIDLDGATSSIPGSRSRHSPHNSDENQPGRQKQAQRTIARIAHFSVQEYLISSRIKESKAAYFAITDCDAHEEIARICCIYLKEPGLVYVRNRSTSTPYPLARFSADFWFYHYTHAGKARQQLQCQMLDVFQNFPDTFRILPEQDWPLKPSPMRLDAFSSSPLAVAAWLGLDHILNELMIARTSRPSADTDGVKDHAYNDALLCATTQGHSAIVAVLLRNGADVNFKGYFGSHPLTEAALFGYEELVRFLLKKGADTIGQALCVATHHNREAIVKLLLDHDAALTPRVVTAKDKKKALLSACERGFEGIVRLLLDRGVDLSPSEAKPRDPLRFAINGGHKEIIVMLLKAGADVNAPAGIYLTAIQLAGTLGQQHIVQLLLDHGAKQ